MRGVLFRASVWPVRAGASADGVELVQALENSHAASVVLDAYAAAAKRAPAGISRDRKPRERVPILHIAETSARAAGAAPTTRRRGRAQR